MNNLTFAQEYILSTGVFINVIVAVIVVFSLFEFLLPAQKNQSVRGKIRNLGFIAVHILFGGTLLFFLTQYFAPIISVPSHESIFRSLLSVLAIIFVGDILFYWYHRAQHSFQTLWPLHELHHAETELNATTSLRAHFLERPIQYALLSFPVALLFSILPFLSSVALDATASIMLPFIFTTWLFFNHANLRLSLGKATKLVTGPQLHRIHHSLAETHRDTNFAQFFPIIDIVFGTFKSPEKGEFPATGTPNMTGDVSIVRATVKPFSVWSKKILSTMRKFAS